MAKFIRRSGPAHIVFAATAATMAVGSIMPTAASPVQDAYRAHTALCVGLFFNDKPAHNVQCLPNSSISGPASTGGTSVFAPPPPPVVIPVVDAGSSYPDAGSSYPDADSSYPDAGSSFT